MMMKTGFKNVPGYRPIRCKYCNGEGHQLRTCKKRKYDEANLPEMSSVNTAVEAKSIGTMRTASTTAPVEPKAERGKESTATPENANADLRGYERGTIRDAIAIITEPTQNGEGYRHGSLGNSRKGKTTGIKKILAYNPKKQLTIIHDDTKQVVQYDGAVVERIEDAPDDAETVIFRGDPYQGTRVEVDMPAAIAIQYARCKVPVRLVIDEASRACTETGMRLSSPALKECLTQGGMMGLCVLWGNQMPQETPQAFWASSTTIAIYQLERKSLNYMDERLYLNPEMLDIVEKLMPGEFVLHRQSFPWDRKIYYSPM